MRKLILAAVIALAAFAAPAWSQVMASGQATTGAGSALVMTKNAKTFQATGNTTAGSGSASISIQGSNDGSNWDTIGTITLTLGTATTSNSFTSNDRYNQHRANVTAISGTGASVSVFGAY
jgi:Tfp pilus assembly protein FimT